MSLGLRLDVRQSQGLVLTPQLQQAIKLLQLSNLELQTVVDRELTENPFLERKDSATTAAAITPEREPVLDGRTDLRPVRGEPDDGWAAPVVGSAADSRMRLSRSGAGGFEDSDGALEARLTRPESLAEHLRAQLVGAVRDEEDRRVALALTDFVDEDGYLREGDRELAVMLAAEPACVTRARAALQRCEPVGVGARDLAECLRIQLAERDRFDPAMAKLLDHLPLVARADFVGLQRVCEVDLEDLREMITEIKDLDPRPGLQHGPGEPVEAIPDIIVQRGSRDTWRIELNQATLPRVLVDRAYYAEISRAARDRREKEFLSERYQAAAWLAKALDQRARTVLRVAKAIFERQLGFLERGPEHLRPLVLRDIAAVTGLHESTVSRATSEKFAATPRGTFPLRYFFTTAIAGADGAESHSAEAIRQQIRRMIDGEPGEQILSDDQIVLALKQSGVVIARRTVAKYREFLGIPSSVQRRRAKALSA